MSELVTVLFPNFNNEDFLTECLDSINNQSYKEFKILIIDDGSTDRSIEIINNYPDSRITLLKKDQNSGIVDTLNYGLEHVDTKYIIRHDGDDLMHPDRIKILVEFMESNPEIGVCGSDVQYIGSSNGTIVYTRSSIQNKANLIFGHSVAHASCIFKSEIFLKHSIRYRNDYPLAEDYDLFYRIKDLVDSTSVPHLLYLCRLWERNEPAKMLLIRKPVFIKMFERVLADLEIYDSTAALVHFELSKQVEPTFQYADYQKHIETVIENNRRLKIFPEKEMESTVRIVLKRILFRLIDINKASTMCIISNPQVWRYVIGKKLSKSS